MMQRKYSRLIPAVISNQLIRFFSPHRAQSHEIRLPQNFTCEDCTLRLLRQADEWTNAYRFWSCADIDIKPRKEYRETCSGHGKYLATRCKCDKNYYGNRCQYWDECTIDADCGIQGKCIDIGGTALPRKQCYCKLGWFGSGCNKSKYMKFKFKLFNWIRSILESSIKSTDIDYSLYTTKTLTPEFRIHWRILKEQKEIEMVLTVNGTSWVGFGWRPKTLTAECRKFPKLHDAGYEAAAEPSSEPTAAPEGSAEPEPSSRAEPTSAPETSAEPEPESASEPSSKKSEQLTAASSKSKRVASPQQKTPSSKDEYTVSTSVSYRVSSVAGRRKRAVEKGKIKFPISLSLHLS